MKQIINVFSLLLGLKLRQYNTNLVQLNHLFSVKEDAKRRLEESKSINEDLQIQIVNICKSKCPYIKFLIKYSFILQIRVKSNHKKLTKNIEKLKSLNASRIKLDVGENDKLKVAKSKLKLKLIKLMTKTHINKNSKGFTVNISNLETNPIQFNKNNSKEINQVQLWNNIGRSTVYFERWSSLFN